MKKLLISSLLALGIACPAISQDAAAPAAAAEAPAGGASAAKVDELMKAMDMEKTMKDASSAILPVMLAQMKQAGMPAAANAEVEAAFEAYMTKLMADEGMHDKIKGLYGREFTDDEIQVMIDFYQTPTGKKFLSKQGAIMAESAQIGQETAQKYLPEFQAKIGEIVKKHQ